jgi:ribose transport system permease protein
VFGRYIFALGSNETTARLCGINVPWTKIAVYGISGLFVGVAGMYQFARLSQGDPTSGIGLELEIIAAVVIGGASLNGGRGSILGTLAGAVMTQVIQTGCTLLGLQDFFHDIVIGAVILAAVTVDEIRRRYLDD